MVSPKMQRIIDQVIGERITALAALIRAQEEPNASIAAEQLSLIGTKAAADTLVELFTELEDETLAFMLLVSPHRDDYKDLLAKSMDPEALAEAYADLGAVNTSLMTMEPLIHSIAEALEKDRGTCGESCSCAST